MVSSQTREYLKVQLLETQRMLQMIGSHPLMSLSLKQKEQELLTELDNIPVDVKETKVILLFSGNPVNGSMGIDANFTGNIVVPFQNMVTSEFSHHMYGRIGSRGQMFNKGQSRLFLTALPRGSFGIELSKLDSNNQTEEDQLADAIAHITKLVDSSSRSDEAFAAELDEVTPRTIQNLKKFFKVMADEQAGVSIQSGGTRCDLNINQVKNAYERVSATKTTESTIKLRGTLRGLLLESGKFDFTDEFSSAITGTIDDKLSEDVVSTYFNKICTVNLNEGKVLFKNGREKLTYVLLSIEP